MDSTEAGGSQREQDGRVFADGFGYLLAATKSCCHKSKRVAPVEGGTGPTHGLSPTPARFQQDTVGKIAGVEPDVEIASVAESDHPSRQPHRSLTAPHRPNLGFERVEATGGMQPGDDPVDDAVFVNYLC